MIKSQGGQLDQIEIGEMHLLTLPESCVLASPPGALTGDGSNDFLGGISPEVSRQGGYLDDNSGGES